MNLMKQKLDLLGSICGVMGAAVSVVAVILRLVLVGKNPTTVLIAPRNVLLVGIALMVFGCWAKLTAKDN